MAPILLADVHGASLLSLHARACDIEVRRPKVNDEEL